jgi:hypothetical protein
VTFGNHFAEEHEYLCCQQFLTISTTKSSVSWAAESFAAVRDARLQEAADTDADLLVDVCHYCHEVFVKGEPRCAYRVVNYISLAAEALGIEREDVFRKYTHWGDLDRILLDADPLIRQSPFSRERIIEVLTRTFCDVFGCPPDRM